MDVAYQELSPLTSPEKLWQEYWNTASLRTAREGLVLPHCSDAEDQGLLFVEVASQLLIVRAMEGTGDLS